jgi:hypothetical protein
MLPVNTRRRLPAGLPALGVAAFALVVAAGSGAAAGSFATLQSLPAGSVTSRAIKDGTIVAKDVSAGTRRSFTVVNGYQVLTFESAPIAVGATGTISRGCPTGTRVLGVAADWKSDYETIGSRISFAGTGATAYGLNARGTVADIIILTLACGRATSPSTSRTAAVPATKAVP